MEVKTMSIHNVRYWDSPEVDTSLASGDKVNSEAFIKDYQNSFDSALFDIFGQSGFHSKPLYNSSFFGYDLNSPDQLREASAKAKSMGMEKVLAAQLSSPLPFSNTSFNDEKNDSYGGLDRITNLTVQLQMAKAHKVIERLEHKETKSLEEFVATLGDSEVNTAEANFEGIKLELDAALETLKEQVTNISTEFDISYDEVIYSVKRNPAD